MQIYSTIFNNDLLLKSLMISALIFGYILSITENPIYSALSLIAVLISTSLILWFIGAEFLAMMYIIVYLGAIAVLFLFVVMMLNIETETGFKRLVSPSKFHSFFHKIFHLIKKFYFWYILVFLPHYWYGSATLYTIITFIAVVWFFLITFGYTFLAFGFVIFTIFFYKKAFFLYWFRYGSNVYDFSFTVNKSKSFLSIFNFFYYLSNAGFHIFFVILILLIIFSPLNFYDNSVIYQIAINNNLFIKLHASNYLQNTAQIGELLYVEFGFLFILSAFILLVAMVGTILLTLKKSVVSKNQLISRQVNKSLKNSVSLYKIRQIKK